MLINHRVGSNDPGEWTKLKQRLLKTYFQLLSLFVNGHMSPMVRVRMVFRKEYFMPGQDQADWRKAFGTKDGVNTDTNDEAIAVYRYVGNRWETGHYERQEGERKVVTQRQYAYQDYTGSAKEAVVYLRLAHAFTAYSYAGGDKDNKSDYSFECFVAFVSDVEANTLVNFAN